MQLSNRAYNRILCPLWCICVLYILTCVVIHNNDIGCGPVPAVRVARRRGLRRVTERQRGGRRLGDVRRWGAGRGGQGGGGQPTAPCHAGRGTRGVSGDPALPLALTVRLTVATCSTAGVLPVCRFGKRGVRLSSHLPPSTARTLAACDLISHLHNQQLCVHTMLSSYIGAVLEGLCSMGCNYRHAVEVDLR